MPWDRQIDQSTGDISTYLYCPYFPANQVVALWPMMLITTTMTSPTHRIFPSRLNALLVFKYTYNLDTEHLVIQMKISMLTLSDI